MFQLKTSNAHDLVSAQLGKHERSVTAPSITECHSSYLKTGHVMKAIYAGVYLEIVWYAEGEASRQSVTLQFSKLTCYRKGCLSESG